MLQTLKSVLRAAVGKIILAIGLFISLYTQAAMIPPGLDPGDQFQYVFVTSTSRNATSSNITDYDSHVQSAATLGSETAAITTAGTTWKVLGSTMTVDAIDNINQDDCGANGIDSCEVNTDGLFKGFYLLDGTHIASSYADFFDNAIASPINRTENNVVLGGAMVFTGSFPNGNKHFSLPLGNAGDVEFGRTDQTGNGWAFAGSANNADSLQFYGVSSAQTVAAVPEIDANNLTIALALLALVALRREQTIDRMQA